VVTYYRLPPIGTLFSLARMLKTAPDQLLALAETATTMYRPVPMRKKDGSVRLTFDAFPPLKSAQARIQCLILRRVDYPPYLLGGLKGRDHARNAEIHCGCRTLVSEDITSFFDSVSADLIYDIWSRLFRFPPTVAGCLTKLTTKDGRLPQGAKTSSFLANLVFWREEPALYEHLARLGIQYTRFIDDITCSSKRDLTNSEISHVVERIAGMCKAKRLKLKRSKYQIIRAGSRMVATKLVVNERVALPTEERSNIRWLTLKLARSSSDLRRRRSESYTEEYHSISGRLGTLKRFHLDEATKLRTILREVKPL